MGNGWLLYDKYLIANSSSSVVWKVWVTWNPVWRWKLAQRTVLCFISRWFNLKGKQFANSDLSISLRMSHWINVFIWCSSVTFHENCELSLSGVFLKLQIFAVNSCWSLRIRNTHCWGSTEYTFSCQEVFLFFAVI